MSRISRKKIIIRYFLISETIWLRVAFAGSVRSLTVAIVACRLRCRRCRCALGSASLPLLRSSLSMASRPSPCLRSALFPQIVELSSSRWGRVDFSALINVSIECLCSKLLPGHLYAWDSSLSFGKTFHRTVAKTRIE